MFFLKQSTASQEIPLGYFVDSANGDTAEPSLTIANTDIKLWKSGATTLANKNSGGATHIADGIYYAVLDATDTNTVGPMRIHVHVTGALPVIVDCYVLEEAIYDSLFAASATAFNASGRVDVGSWLGTAVATPTTAGVPEVDVTYWAGTAATLSSTTSKPEVDAYSISDDATAANNAELMFDGTGYAGGTTKLTVDISTQAVDDVWNEAYSGHLTAGSMGAALGGAIAVAGTIQSAGNGTTTVELPSTAVAVDDFYNNMILEVVSGTGAGQSEYISAYVGSTQVATLNGTLGTALVSGDSVVQVRKSGTIPGASAPTTDQVASAVWDKLAADHKSEGSFGQMLQPIQVGTAQAGTTSSITLDATGLVATTDHYRYAEVVIIGGTGAGQSRQITTNTSAGVCTVAPAWTTAPDATSTYIVRPLGLDATTVEAIADQVWDEARAGHGGAGTFGEYVLADAVRVSGATAAADGLEAAVAGTTPLPANVTQWLGTAAATPTTAGVPEVDVTFVGGSAQDLPTATALATVDANVDAILVDTGTTIPAILGTPAGASMSADIAANLTAINALNDITVADILTTQMTESYAAQGVAPTLAQALFGIHQLNQEAARSGTTLTVKKLDQSTAAYTITLDSGTNPTSITRAT